VLGLTCVSNDMIETKKNSVWYTESFFCTGCSW